LLDEYAPATVGCVHPRAGDTQPLPADPMALIKERARPTYDRIWRLWQDFPQRKWQTFRNQSISVGEARLTSLNPLRPIGRQAWDNSTLNDLSSAMLLAWHDLRLLLGADTTTNAWTSIAAEFPELGNHAAMKVPHHGSKGAIHEAFGVGPRDRIWIVTPFKRKRLPGADNGQGLDLMLNYVDRIRLTALPFRHDREGEPRCRTTREAVRDNVRPRRIEPPPDDSVDRLERHVILAFDSSGALQGTWHGRGTLVVRP